MEAKGPKEQRFLQGTTGKSKISSMLPTEGPKDIARTGPPASFVPCVSDKGAGWTARAHGSQCMQERRKNQFAQSFCVIKSPSPPFCQTDPLLEVLGRGHAVPTEQEVTMHRFIRQWCCTRGQDRSLFTFGKGWQRVSSTHVGGGNCWPGPLPVPC